MGIGSSLIYAPAFYAKTDELIELCKIASEYDGMYISHLRSEGDNWLEAIDELITIAKEADIPAEIYHLKAGGKHNWHKYEPAIRKIDSARAAGLEITTDMYTYTAGATGLGRLHATVGTRRWIWGVGQKTSGSGNSLAGRKGNEGQR